MRRMIIVFLVVLATGLKAQKSYPLGYFRSPVDTAISLAGNFGEIRPNHFHAGFDIKTNNHEGMPVHAVADGYISRIKISPFGYGNALYITHPNGYTSAYGHLQRFEGAIAAFTRTTQYSLQTFDLDTALKPDVFPVSAGQLIAYSGNTGSSEGPHLHFELRETASEQPINPYYFGYTVPDTVAPKINRIAVYPLGQTATVNGKHEVKQLVPKMLKNNSTLALPLPPKDGAASPLLRGQYYETAKNDTITVNGDIGFGIDTYDNESNSKSPNGVYSIELQSGGRRVFYEELSTFSFDDSRYVNAHIDYAEKKKHGIVIQKCFLAKNNRLGIYKNVLNNGILHLADDSVHWIRFIVKDYAGNSSELLLKVKCTSQVRMDQKNVAPAPDIDCSKEYSYVKNDIRLSIPANALYSDAVFSCTATAPAKETFSPLYQILSDEIPLHKSYTLSIKAPSLPESLQSKACIVSISDKGRRSYEGGTYANGAVTTQTRSFGKLAVAIDTIAPKLKPAFKAQKNKTPDLGREKTLGIIATDNLSGIRNYRATIDGKWALMAYDFKKNLLFYTFDDTLSAGEHIFNMDVSDDKGNTSNINFLFTR